MAFNKDKLKGKIGESVAWNILTSYNWVRNFVDVREDLRFQKWDVDFLIQDYNYQYRWIEVKSDTMAWNTGNICYEIECNGQPGCFERTAADYVMYYTFNKDSLKGIMYMIDVQKIRKHIQDNIYVVRTLGDNSKCMLIPVNRLKDNNIIIREWEID